MALDLTLQQWIEFVANGAMALLGVGLALWRSRQRAAVLLGLFLGTLGVLSAMGALGLQHGWVSGLGVLLRIIAGSSLTALAVIVPHRAEARERSVVVVAAGVAALYVVAILGNSRFEGANWGDAAGDAVLGFAAIFAFVTLPLRFRLARKRSDRLALALLGAGFCFFASQNAGEILDDGANFLSYVSVVALLGTSALWLWATSAPDGWLARNVAISICAGLLANMMVVAWSASPELAGATGRFLGLGLLSYAVLRGLIAGLDTRVHLAISKGTVAAIFIVVFFLASELAQQFFAERYTAVVGILAAGILLFALAPLQRAAERLAERAVPLSPAPQATGAAAVYQAALRAAMRDGMLTRREEKHLAEVARGLGLDPVQAHELRDEVERADAPDAA